jgi:hypothetical protein
LSALKSYSQHPNAFSIDYLNDLRGAILASPYFATNNLNRDFIGTKGFSVVFGRSQIAEVERRFPLFKPYLDRALQPECNAFYLNPASIRILIDLCDRTAKRLNLPQPSAYCTCKCHQIWKEES